MGTIDGLATYDEGQTFVFVYTPPEDPGVANISVTLGGLCLGSPRAHPFCACCVLCTGAFAGLCCDGLYGVQLHQIEPGASIGQWVHMDKTLKAERGLGLD